MYLRGTSRSGRRGLGQLLPMDIPTEIAVNAAVPSGCNWWEFFTSPASWSACQTAQEVAQIQTVPANAAYYGYSPAVVSAAQVAADQQSGFAVSDTNDIATQYSAGQLVTTSSIPTWLWVAGAIGGGLLLIAALK